MFFFKKNQRLGLKALPRRHSRLSQPAVGSLAPQHPAKPMASAHAQLDPDSNDENDDDLVFLSSIGGGGGGNMNFPQV